MQKEEDKDRISPNFAYPLKLVEHITAELASMYCNARPTCPLSTFEEENKFSTVLFLSGIQNLERQNQSTNLARGTLRILQKN
jgi:hypothetical protein